MSTFINAPTRPITPRSWRAAVATQGLPAAHARLYWCQEATDRARDDSSARARSPCRTHFHVQTLRGAPTNALPAARAHPLCPESSAHLAVQRGRRFLCVQVRPRVTTIHRAGTLHWKTHPHSIKEIGSTILTTTPAHRSYTPEMRETLISWRECDPFLPRWQECAKRPPKLPPNKW